MTPNLVDEHTNENVKKVHYNDVYNNSPLSKLNILILKWFNTLRIRLKNLRSQHIINIKIGVKNFKRKKKFCNT